MSAVIAAERLTKHYGSSRGIAEVDLEVRSGEVFGFLGPNGAGKTTTIRTLLDLIRPTSGRAEVLGLDSHADSVAIRERVGFLSGDLALYERLTGRRHLDWLADLRGGVDPTVRDALVERFEVELDRPIRDLSKGNRQKVGLVQAFMHEPELLMLDEPTSGLDPLMQDEFHRLVREVVDAGRTVFLSSHSIDEVQRLADRVGIIRQGRMVAVDTVDDLVARAVRRVEARLADPPDAGAFEALDGVEDLDVRNGEVRFSYRGDMDELVKLLARHHVTDLTSQAADLETIFLEYYRGNGEAPSVESGPGVPGGGPDA